MSRTYFSAGARGDLIGQLQNALLTAGFNPGSCDEVFGSDTVRALNEYQKKNGLPCTGCVDEATWKPLMKCDAPSLFERALQLTMAFEGHNYTLAKGNFDGAWLTWGIIGFTMKFGQVQALILEICKTNPALVAEAFGPLADEIKSVCSASPTRQEQWATALTQKNGNLVEPWHSAFQRFGSFPEVRAAQRQRAFEKYFKPALVTAEKWGLNSELGKALAFDIHVQNGGIKPAAVEQIRRQPPASGERQMRERIAHAVADNARPQYREDVRSRKLTIARGEGIVHGRKYALAQWALADVPA